MVDEGEECDDNTDLSGSGWFDACVTAPGNNVEITIWHPNNFISDQARGTKVGVWNFNQLTSTAAGGEQFDVAEHDRAILLDNGDLLRISGKGSTNWGCGGSMGNGYVIVIYENPIQDVYTRRIKLLIAPYNFTISRARDLERLAVGTSSRTDPGSVSPTRPCTPASRMAVSRLTGMVSANSVRGCASRRFHALATHPT